MTDRSQLPAGVPHLLDQYKQRRQAWLDQADELARLRDEVRLAAEREAIDIVTAARRDVRRIVVEARRELLVLTAQLHAAIESVDQASLPPGDAPDAGHFAARVDGLGSVEALGATRDAVLGARREVRSVLDEARAEIEALAAEARTPPPEPPSAFFAVPEPPIPTLDTILGADSTSHLSSSAGLPPAIDLQAAIDRTVERDAASARTHVGGIDLPNVIDVPAVIDMAAVPELPAAPAPPQPPASLPTALELTATAPQFAARSPRLAHELDVPGQAAEPPVSFVLAPDADTMLAGFHKRDTEPHVASSLETFGETGPVHAPEVSTTFLDDYDGATPRTRPMWAWVGMFAATGVLLLAGAAWWVQARANRSSVLESITATNPTEPPADGAKPVPANGEAPAGAAPTSAAAAPAAPAGLAIEVRRTSWIRAIVDGKEDSRVYQAGETRTIAGARTVSLRAGDGGAVFVSVDGRAAEVLGASGTAVTRQYSLAGPAVVPAIATAPTATAAAAATATTGTTATRDAAALPPAGLNAGRTPAAPTVPPRATDTPATIPPTPQTTAPAAPAEGPVPAAPVTGGRADLVSAGQQWLDAYQRRDQNGMSAAGTENMTVSDERTLTERFPAWQTGIRRDLDQVELELTGDTALLTARMTERNADNGASSAQHVSRISQIWVRRNGRWRVADVRIMGEGRLNQIVR